MRNVLRYLAIHNIPIAALPAYQQAAPVVSPYALPQQQPVQYVPVQPAPVQAAPTPVQQQQEPTIPVSALPALLGISPLVEQRARAVQDLAAARPSEEQQTQTPQPEVPDVGDDEDEIRAARLIAGQLQRLETRLDRRDREEQDYRLSSHRERRIAELRAQGVGFVESVIQGRSAEEIDAAVNLARAEYDLVQQQALENHYRTRGWDPTALRNPTMPQQQAMLVPMVPNTVGYAPAGMAPPAPIQGVVQSAPQQVPQYSFPSVVAPAAPITAPQPDPGQAILQAIQANGGRRAAVRSGAYAQMREGIMQAVRGTGYGAGRNRPPFASTPNLLAAPLSAPPAPPPPQVMQYAQPAYAQPVQGVPQFAPQYAPQPQPQPAFPGAAPQYQPQAAFVPPGYAAQPRAPQYGPQGYAQAAPQPAQLDSGQVAGFDPGAVAMAAQAAIARRSHQRVGNHH